MQENGVEAEPNATVPIGTDHFPMGTNQNPIQTEFVPKETAPGQTSQAQEAVWEDDDDAMSLPLSKIRRILKMDPEYFGSSATAVYAAGAATELFVQYMVEQASMNAKVDKRKKIQYKDLSSAVSSQEALYFLSDAIPKTQVVRDALKEKKINLSEEDKKKYDAGENSHAEVIPEQPEALQALPKGQSTLPFASAKKINKAGISNLMDNDAMQVD